MTSPSKSSPSPDMTEEWRQSLRYEKYCRSLALDYSLAASLIALFPLTGFYAMRFVLMLLLLAVMLWEIGRVWHFSRGQDALAIAGNLFGALGAIATGFVVWLGLLTAGIWLPYVGSFKGAAGLFSLTWMLGQSTNQYYAIGYRRQLLRKVKYASS